MGGLWALKKWRGMCLGRNGHGNSVCAHTFSLQTGFGRSDRSQQLSVGFAAVRHVTKVLARLWWCMQKAEAEAGRSLNLRPAWSTEFQDSQDAQKKILLYFTLVAASGDFNKISVGLERL